MEDEVKKKHACTKYVVVRGEGFGSRFWQSSGGIGPAQWVEALRAASIFESQPTAHAVSVREPSSRVIPLEMTVRT